MNASSLVAISHGWGVQSFTLSTMSALGKLDHVDVAIHADTTWERQATYEFAQKWTPWLESKNIRVVTVRDKWAAHRIIDDSMQIHIPAYTTTQAQMGDKKGQLRRVCTQRWKIAPIRQWLSKELQRRSQGKMSKSVELWMGISKDEWYRAKDSNVNYITHRFPLLELNMTRADCISWLSKNGFDIPGKSSCVFCPYHSPAFWESMKRESGDDWRKAIEIDKIIRNRRINKKVVSFVNSKCVPLSEAVSIAEDYGYTQLDLLETPVDAMCDSGYCFL